MDDAKKVNIFIWKKIEIANFFKQSIVNYDDDEDDNETLKPKEPSSSKAFNRSV